MAFPKGTCSFVIPLWTEGERHDSLALVCHLENFIETDEEFIGLRHRMTHHSGAAGNFRRES